MEPRLSKLLLASFDYLCTEEVLTIVAMLQVCMCVCAYLGPCCL